MTFPPLRRPVRPSNGATHEDLGSGERLMVGAHDDGASGVDPKLPRPGVVGEHVGQAGRSGAGPSPIERDERD